AGARERRTDHGDRRHLREQLDPLDREAPWPRQRAADRVAVQARPGGRVEHRAADFHHPANHQELTVEDVMRTSIRLIGLAALIAGTVSCGDVVRQGSSPVFLVIHQLTAIRGGLSGATPSSTLISDVITNGITPAPCSADSPCPTILAYSVSVILRAPLKDPGATASLSPTTNNEVTINRVHV